MATNTKNWKTCQGQEKNQTRQNFDGKQLIMKIGTMSALLEFLGLKSRMMFNRLCKHVFRVAMPAVSGKFAIIAPG